MSPRARRRRLVRQSFRVFCCAIFLLGTGPRTIGHAAPPDRKPKIDSDEILQKIYSSTVKIKAFKYVGGTKTVSDGAGVVIDAEGYILTATHVVEDLDQITVTTVDGDQMRARVVLVDREYDITLLKVNPTVPLEVAKFAAKSSVASGTEVAVIGNPLAMGQKIVKGILGEVKTVNWGGNRAALHTVMANILQGNSGGGTFDLATGMFLGINVAKSNARQNEGYMVPVDRLVAILKRKNSIGELADSQEIEDTLGVRLRPVSLVDNAQFTKGMLVTSVEPNSAAAAAGWEVGDVLVGLDSYKTADLDSVLYVLHDSKRDASDIKFLLARGDSVDPGKISVKTTAALAASTQASPDSIALAK